MLSRWVKQCVTDESLMTNERFYMKKSVLLASLICLGTSVQGQAAKVTAGAGKLAPKVAIVNLQQLVSTSKEGQALGQAIAQERQNIFARIQEMQSELKAEGEQFEKQAALMSQEKKVEKQQELTKKSADFQRKTKAMQEDWERDMQLKQEMLARKVVESAIEICKKDGYQMLLDSRMAYWVDEKLDITQDSIKVADNNYGKELLAAKKEKTNAA